MKKFLSVLISAVLCLGLTACNDPDNGGGNNPPEYFANADILAYSYSRMENADLSFNFEVKASTESGDARLVSNITTGGAYVEDGKYIMPNTTEAEAPKTSLFDQYNDMLEGVRDSCRETVDYVIEKVTVMDTIVNNFGNRYILHYDSENDIVTVYKYYESSPEPSEGGDKIGSNVVGDDSNTLPAVFDDKITSLDKITFYYDEQGCETVEYYRYDVSKFNGIVDYSATSIVYTPGKKYSIKTYGCQIDPQTLQVASDDGISITIADRSSGKWQGVSFSRLTRNNAYFTKQGDYNGSDLIFLFETDQGVFCVSGRILVNRDGTIIYGGGVPAMAEDEVFFAADYVDAPGFFTMVDYEKKAPTMFSSRLDLFKGWNKAVLNYTEGSFHMYFGGEGSFIEYENGVIVESNATYWNEDIGFIKTIDAEDGNGLLTEDGQTHDYTWLMESVDMNKTIQISGGQMYINPETMQPTSGLYIDYSITGGFSTWDDSMTEDLFGVVAKYFKVIGLEHENYDVDKIINLTDNVCRNTDVYVNSLSNSFLGFDFTVDNLKNYIASECDKAKALAQSFSGFRSGYEVVNMSDLPKLPSNFTAISLDGKISGKVTVSQSGLDFSAVSVSVEKSVLLGDQNEYGICAVFDGEGSYAVQNAFESKKYSNANMTINGKSSAVFPELSVGSYELKLYFGKNTDGGYAKISNMVSANVNSFSDFNYQIQGNGGYYQYSFTYEGGKAYVDVDFVDQQAPTIELKNSTVHEDETYLAFNADATVIDLIGTIKALDNYDGAITLTNDNVVLITGGGEQAVGITSSLVNQGRYKVKVKDSQGNLASVEFIVITAQN